MTEIIIQNAVQIVATLLITLIGVLGAWLTAKIAKRTELNNIAAATDAVINAAQLTVLELQQTVVEGWKAASADGKLSEDEIKQLGAMLYQKTLEKMADSTKDLLNAAGVDITAIITGAGEAMIQTMKR